jgi:hypothetical protein
VTVGVVVALLVISVGVTAAVAYPVGARAQGRWFLPIAVMLPVLLVEQIGRRRAGRDPWRWRVVAVVAVGTVVAAVQALALWVSARRDAVGIDGPFQFVGHSQWAPPLGWGVWLLLGGLGCAALALSAVQAVRIGDRSASGSGPVAATPAVRG